MLPGLAARLPRRPAPSTLVALACLAVPFAIEAVRIVASSYHVYLSDDLALVDLHVRDAINWKQQLGPFDRFGWNHPGPAYFYLLSIPARVFGSGARAEFLGAVAINALAALATIWVVRRRCGARSALWCAACIGLLCTELASTSPGATTFSESRLGALVSPWNPDVVILPLLLVGALCASGATGSPLSLLGAALVGSFCVQTNFATFPLVVALLVAGSVAALVRRFWSRRHPDPEARSETRDYSPAPPPSDARRRPSVVPTPWILVPGLVLLVLVWVPPLAQQAWGHPGNLALIWRFFTAHHQPHSLGTGLWSILAVDDVFLFGLPEEMSFFLGSPPRAAALVLAGVLVVGVSAVVIGFRRRNHLACALGATSLLGFVVCIWAVTRIVGGVYGYLVLWEIGVPVLGLVGLGSALLERPPVDEPGLSHVPGGAQRTSLDLPARDSLRRLRVSLASVVPASVATVFAVVLCVQMVRLPPLKAASDPTVETAWQLVSPHLPRTPEHIYLGDEGIDLYGLFTFFGLFDELQSRGFHPRVNPFLQTEVGPLYLSDGREPLQIVFYPPSKAVPKMAGYVGRTPDVEIVVEPGPPGR